MKTVEVYSLPKLRFAHVYKAGSYTNNINASKKYIEVTYISEGELLLEDEAGSILAQKGDVLCLLQDTVIRTSGFHSHHTVCVDLDWDYVENSSQGLYLPMVTKEAEGTEKIRQLIDDVVFNFPVYENSQTKCAGKFLEILCKIDLYNRKTRDLKMPGTLLYAERAKKYIHRHIYQPITQMEVAEHLEITPEYLCSIFKKTQGITLMKYVNKTKLDGIKDLMDREHIPLYKAAALFGFADANYVSRLYKSFFGHNITDKPDVSPPL